MTTNRVRFTTKELSTKTWPDFEQFFSRNGRGSCACMLYQRGRHLSEKKFPSRDERRVEGLREKKELVEQGRAHGILVYADGEPVGWCQYGPVDELPIVRTSRTAEWLLVSDPSSLWRITCFLTLMGYRQQGVASIALGAVVEAVRERGGGWIEATPMVFCHYDPDLPKLRRTYRWGSPEVKEHLERTWPERDIPGLGRVTAAEVTPKTAPHLGTMSMFERLGFTPTKRRGQDGVVMHLHV